MRILITGGAGFIGSHLADYYLAQGSEILVLDNFSTGSDNNISHMKNRITLIDDDIRNTVLLNSLIPEVDLVLHMAAAVGVNTILESPIESMSTNIFGSGIKICCCI